MKEENFLLFAIGGAPMFISQFDPDQLTQQDADRLLYNGVQDDLRNGDCILVFGSQKCLKYRVPKAIELYKNNRARKILFSGGNVWEGQSDAEAVLMKQAAIDQGIPEEHILTEAASKYTKENVLLSAKILDRDIGLNNIKRLLLVTTNYHMRRCFLTCKTYLPAHIEYVLCPVDDQSTKRNNWFLNDKGKARAVEECKKIIAYVRNGQLTDWDV